MLFTEFEFIFYFIPLLLAVYALLSGRTEARTLCLFAASILFYGLWDWHYVPMLLASVAVNFYLGKKIHNSPSDKKRFRLALLSVALALLPLLWFKYSLFIAETFNFDKGWYGVLPLGISFYTFQQITYIIDVYKRKLEPAQSFIRYGFFVTFFPQLIAGPIVHYKEIVPQIDQPKDRDALFGAGVIYFSIGFVKKFFIADNIARLINPVYDQAAGQVVSFTDSLLATLGYTFQLYFDFSGYSDMAMGLALLFGFRLPFNFYSPYKAASIIDFWRRWHMTLSTFLKDYIYIPLGGNRYAPAQQWKRHRNLLLTMLIGGLWHGAAWTFVVWGGLHGLALVINHGLHKWVGQRKFLHLLGYPVTFTFVALAWVLFRAEDFTTATHIYQGYFSTPDLTSFKWTSDYLWFVVAGILILAPNSHQVVEKLHNIQKDLSHALRPMLEKRAIFYLLIAHILWFPIVHSFYTSEWDRKLYANLPIERFEHGIDNKSGDFRSNLYNARIMPGEEKKIIFAGSSFTLGMGLVYFDLNGKYYRSGTVGMGGNNIYVGLRTAQQILDTPNLDTLVLGTAALNMYRIRDTKPEKVYKKQRAYVGPFPYECLENIHILGLDFKTGFLSRCTAIENTSLAENLAMFLLFPSDLFFQFHGMMQKIATYDHDRPEDSPQTIPTSPEDRKEFYSELETYLEKVDQQNQPPESKNGANTRFKWENRKTIEQLQAGEPIYEALKNLKAAAEKRGVNFVLYSTPTVKHTDAPFVYPKGYHEGYQEAMRNMAKELNIPYYDYSFFLPWEEEVMYDFIHARYPIRQELHKHMIYKMIDDGVLK